MLKGYKKPIYEQALSKLSELGHRSGEAIVLRRIATTYDNLNQPNEALEWYEKSLSVYRGLNKPDGEATVLNDMGTVYRALGHYRDAMDVLARALTYSQVAGRSQGDCACPHQHGCDPF
jgi:tetratricopeptide (TPR) repeat protein